MTKHNVLQVFVPGSCTEIQPPDLAWKELIKSEMRTCFRERYSDHTAKDLKDGTDLTGVKVHLLSSLFMQGGPQPLSRSCKPDQRSLSVAFGKLALLMQWLMFATLVFRSRLHSRI